MVDKISQRVTLPATPMDVYETLMSSARHAKFSGAPAKILSPPTVIRRRPPLLSTGRCLSIRSRAASRSAVPDAMVTPPPTARPWRFSVSAWPM